MSKKSLLILLILPFILSVLFFVASNFLFTKIEGDITNITWDYRNHEGFALEDKKIQLKATPILANNEEDVNSTLTWSVRNIDQDETPHAYVEVEDDISYLMLSSVGDVEVKCTNNSGNISKTFNATIYQDGVIILNTRRARSFNKIDSLDYYGEYDLVNNIKEKASFYIDVDIRPQEVKESIRVETSSNITYEENTGKIIINDEGDSYIKFGSSYASSIKEQVYNFKAVKDGINVYSYNDLIKCTSQSENGEVVCLQTNLESFKNTYIEDENGELKLQNDITSLFGNYNEEGYSFKDEVHYFTSTYNTEYIDQFNAQQKNDSTKISKELVAGVRIQKDFYGNGYIINAHNLTFPTKVHPQNKDLLVPSDDALFKGPLPYVLIGNNQMPIVKAYGQDNVGFYVDGDNILLNDVYFKNCDFSSILQNNEMTGTVLEINGDNVTVQNSYISSGRTVLRAFSCKNLLVKNSLLEKGREFIAKVGSNRYEKINLDGDVTFEANGETVTMSKQEFLYDSTGEGSLMYQLAFSVLTDGLLTDITDEDIKNYTSLIQQVLNDVNLTDENGNLIYESSVTFEDTYFYQSGIFSLGLDSMFNGPYLYDGSPVYALLGELIDGVIFPQNIGGVSYPSDVKLCGDTRFYDYKQIDHMDASCLVYQDVSGITGESIDIDSFFPVKKLFRNRVDELGYQHIDNEVSYVNTPIAKYGGGLNLSTLNIDELLSKEHFSEMFTLDTFTESMKATASSDDLTALIAMMIGRCVPMAMGFAPFEVAMYKGNKEGDAYLYGQQISLEDLRSRV